MSAPRILWPHNFDPAIPNAGSFMFHSARALAAEGWEPDLLYLGNLRSASGFRRARDELKEAAAGYDVVHVQFGSASAMVTAAAVSNIPTVVTLRGSDWRPASFRGRWLLHGLSSTAMTNLSLPRFDLVVTVSRRMARQVRRLHPKVPIEVIPSAVDLQMFRPLDRDEARARLGLPDDGARYALFTVMPRTTNWHKRPELAQAAVEVARRSIPNLQLLVASGVPQAEIPYYAAMCDVVLCTSRSEGWPNSVKEALACDVPFVATDISDLREISVTTPPCRVADATPEALGRALVEVLSSPGPHRTRQAVQPMSLPAFARTQIAAYKRVLSRGWASGI